MVVYGAPNFSQWLMTILFFHCYRPSRLLWIHFRGFGENNTGENVESCKGYRSIMVVMIIGEYIWLRNLKIPLRDSFGKVKECGKFVVRYFESHSDAWLPRKHFSFENGCGCFLSRNFIVRHLNFPLNPHPSHFSFILIAGSLWCTM